MEHISKGLCQRRVQAGDPPYFVCWSRAGGAREYKFFSSVRGMYRFESFLKEQGESYAS